MQLVVTCMEAEKKANDTHVNFGLRFMSAGYRPKN